MVFFWNISIVTVFETLLAFVFDVSAVLFFTNSYMEVVSSSVKRQKENPGDVNVSPQSSKKTFLSVPLNQFEKDDSYWDYLPWDVRKDIVTVSQIMIKREVMQALQRKMEQGWDWVHAEARMMPFCPRLQRLIPENGFQLPTQDSEDQIVLEEPLRFDWFKIFCLRCKGFHSACWCSKCHETYAAPRSFMETTGREHCSESKDSDNFLKV